MKDEEATYVNNHGYATLRNPSKMTARQLLEFANLGSMTRSRPADAPLSDEERAGLSPAEFDKLAPQRRLELYNKAMAAREKAAREKR